jgi:hypothetical protein
MKINDMSGQAPVGTTLAILERTLKSMSAIQARIHYSMKQEFRLLKGIIRDYTPATYSYEPVEGDRKATVTLLHAFEPVGHGAHKCGWEPVCSLADIRARAAGL